LAWKNENSAGKSKKFNMQKFGKKTSPPLPQSLQKKKNKKVKKFCHGNLALKKFAAKKLGPKSLNLRI